MSGETTAYLYLDRKVRIYAVPMVYAVQRPAKSAGYLVLEINYYYRYYRTGLSSFRNNKSPTDRQTIRLKVETFDCHRI